MWPVCWRLMSFLRRSDLSLPTICCMPLPFSLLFLSNKVLKRWGLGCSMQINTVQPKIAVVDLKRRQIQRMHALFFCLKCCQKHISCNIFFFKFKLKFYPVRCSTVGEQRRSTNLSYLWSLSVSGSCLISYIQKHLSLDTCHEFFSTLLHCPCSLGILGFLSLILWGLYLAISSAFRWLFL